MSAKYCILHVSWVGVWAAADQDGSPENPGEVLAPRTHCDNVLNRFGGTVDDWEKRVEFSVRRHRIRRRRKSEATREGKMGRYGCAELTTAISQGAGECATYASCDR